MTTRQSVVASVGLVLLASLVLGGETRHQEAVLSAPKPVASAAPAPPPQASDDLEVEKLHRSKRVEPIVDVFAPKVVAAPLPVALRAAAPPPLAEPAVPAPPPAPPAPAAPPLPFRYFGRIVNGDKTSVYVLNGDKDHAVAVGSTIEGAYRVDALSDTTIVFTYLPLGLQQTLSIVEGPKQ